MYFMLKVKKSLYAFFAVLMLCIPATMGNLISVMVHCWGRSEEALVGDKSHIHGWEQGSIAGVSRFLATSVSMLSHL